MSQAIKTRFARWASFLLAGFLALMLLLGAGNLGLIARSIGGLLSLPASSSLNYGRIPAQFAPLRAEFIEQVLGGVISPGPGSGGSSSFGKQQNVSETDLGRFVEAHDLTNDHIRSAREVARIPYTARTNTTQASRDSSDPSDCSQLGGTVWYQYTPQHDAVTIAYTFGTDHAVSLGAFTASPGNLQQVRCDTDAGGNALVAFTAKAGKTYYFQVTSPTGGNLVFNLDPHGVFSRASMTSSGEEASGGQTSPATQASNLPADNTPGAATISNDGRYVAFTSNATNMEGVNRDCYVADPLNAPNTQNACSQVFVRDRLSGSTTLVSRSPSGEPGDSTSYMPFISASGRYVVFESVASNLHPGDDKFSGDTYVYDLVTRKLEHIPVTTRAPDLSHWFYATISADGRYVAFQHPNSDLVPGDTNEAEDVFVYDRSTGSMERVSVSSSGRQSRPPENSRNQSLSPSISADGRYVEFRSVAGDLVDDDTNGVRDTFVHDRLTHVTERISVSSEGTQGNAGSSATGTHGWVQTRISSDGRFVVFASEATNLVAGDTNGAVDVFVRDRAAKKTIRASVSSSGEQATLSADEANSSTNAGAFSISPEGRFVVFESFANNLGPDEDSSPLPDVYLHDLLTSTTTLVTIATNGESAHGWSPAISGQGRFITFTSTASNLVDGDNNEIGDVFVYQPPRLR